MSRTLPITHPAYATWIDGPMGVHLRGTFVVPVDAPDATPA
jgi:hypothetical protein